MRKAHEGCSKSPKSAGHSRSQGSMSMYGALLVGVYIKGLDNYTLWGPSNGFLGLLSSSDLGVILGRFLTDTLTRTIWLFL